jgi:hypothetical protein
MRSQQGLNRFRRSGLKAVTRDFALHAMAHNLSRAVALLGAFFIVLNALLAHPSRYCEPFWRRCAGYVGASLNLLYFTKNIVNWRSCFATASQAGIQCQRGVQQSTIRTALRTALDSRQKHAGMTGRRSAMFRPIVFKIDYAGILSSALRLLIDTPVIGREFYLVVFWHRGFAVTVHPCNEAGSGFDKIFGIEFENF